MESGEEQDAGGAGGNEQQKRKKQKYHRHTPRQIQELETVFRECPHPDEKQRMQLSRDLGLEPRQIKFWFQNRRTQQKAQHERQDNCALRVENDKIRCENIAIRESLKKIMCPTCGVAHVPDDSYFDEQALRIENARLRQELERVSSVASRFLGRPITQLPPVQPVRISSLDLSVGGFGDSDPSFLPPIDLDFLPGSSSAIIPLPFPNAIPDIEKPLMVKIAANAMDELLRMLQTDEPLWTKSGDDGNDILNISAYDRIFTRPTQQLRSPDVRVEASRDRGVVFMSAMALVKMSMDTDMWPELFPTIVSKARTIEVLAPGMSGTTASLLLMEEELQVLSPFVPTREFCFLRYCQQIEEGSWAIIDVSVDFPRDGHFGRPPQSRRLPSGCLIQEMPTNYSKVTWLEHVEISDKFPIHEPFKDLVHSGDAFGANRWIATLQRICERFACQMVSGSSPGELGGVILSPESKRSMMRLSQRMLNNFCSSLRPTNGQNWTMLSGPNDEVRVTVHRSADPSHQNSYVLSAVTSMWLPVSSQRVFSFFKDEHSRAQWDVLCNSSPVQEVGRIPIGSHPGNCISILRRTNSGENNFILQESCTDSSTSMVVYMPVDIAHMNHVMSGESPSYVPLLPSGFAILPDGRQGAGGGGASTSSNPMGPSSGSVISISFQILVGNLQSARLNSESVAGVNSLIATTVQQIKAALNCSSA